MRLYLLIWLEVFSLLACNSKSKGSKDTKSSIQIKVTDQRFKFLESIAVLDDSNSTEFKTKTVTRAPDSIEKRTCDLDALGRHTKCSRSDGDPAKGLTLKLESAYLYGANPWQLLETKEKSLADADSEEHTYTVSYEWGSSGFSKYFPSKISRDENNTVEVQEENTFDDAAFTQTTSEKLDGKTKKYTTSYLDFSSNVIFDTGISSATGTEISHDKVLSFGADGQFSGWKTTTKNGEKFVFTETCTVTPSTGAFSCEEVHYKDDGNINYKYVKSGKCFNYLGLGVPIYYFVPYDLESKKYAYVGSDYETSPSESYTLTLDSLGREETSVTVSNYLFGDAKSSRTTTLKYSYEGNSRKQIKIEESTVEGDSTTPTTETTTFEY
jgi:hypothetical protein